MNVRLADGTHRAPTHVVAYLGEPRPQLPAPGPGEVRVTSLSDLEIRGEVVSVTDSHVELRVTRVKGLGSGREYGHLTGEVITLPRADSVILI